MEGSDLRAIRDAAIGGKISGEAVTGILRQRLGKRSARFEIRASRLIWVYDWILFPTL
jgi:hypothetical protein